MKRTVSIVWDTDGQDPEELGLPTVIEVPEEINPEELDQFLSGEYGFCIDSMSIEENQKNSKTNNK